MSKVYEFDCYGEKANVIVKYSQYRDFRNTAVLLMDAVDGSAWATLSVKINPLEEGYFAVDVNNCPTAEEFLIINNIAKPTGKEIASGFCIYPIFKLTSAEMKKYKAAVED